MTRNARRKVRNCRAAVRSRLALRHQVGHLDAKSRCQPLDIQKGDVPIASLDARDIRPVQACQFRQFLLRNRLLLPRGAKPLPEENENIGQVRFLDCVSASNRWPRGLTPV